ncbi:MAG: hypothetical protein ABI824_00935, partial [Acidobacteriota bacterium]
MQPYSTSRGVSSHRIALAIFAGMAVLLFLLHGNRMVFTNDEGILLEPAQRIAQGARPYVDFFGYMTPGSYWIQALAFKLAGISLIAGRIPVILDLSLQCALVFWLTAKLASRSAATIALIAFTAFQIADPTFLTAQHRWDSATLALLGVCLIPHASSQGKAKPTLWLTIGALLAAAAWCTPSVGIVLATTVVWLAARDLHAHRTLTRDFAKPFLYLTAGAAAISIAAVCLLAAQGAFGAFLEQLAWLRRNYSGINTMPYGSIIGGVDQAVKGSQGMERGVLLAVLTCVELPAILPITAILLWAIAAWRGKLRTDEASLIALLLLSMTALVLTAFPRADVMHLAFVAALPYALTAAALGRLLRGRTAAWVSMAALVFPILFTINYWNTWRTLETVASPVGTLRVQKDQAAALRQVLTQVKPGQSLYVHPYMPILYFAAQAQDPSRFSYLAAGMMTQQDEQQVLSDLEKRPPQWLMYLELTRKEFLRVFPSGTNVDHRFRTLEGWLETNYRPVSDPAV